MKALHFFFLLSSFGKSDGFDVGLVSRYVPSTFTETEPFSSEVKDGAIAIKNVKLFLHELLFAGNFTPQNELFLVKDEKVPIIINDWEYYWSPSFHPSLQNGSFGCKIPMNWLLEVAETMENFKYKTKHSNDVMEVSMEKFLKGIRLNDNTEATEMAWSCLYSYSRCCGIGCCPKGSKPQGQGIFHSVFGYMCGGFMLLCCFVLILSLIMFLCNDVWHRYIPWFPSSPRPPATPRGEAHEMQDLNPANHRSPSRMHLAA